jgi:pimeloyl-ACP methyl ester carboxylesterase
MFTTTPSYLNMRDEDAVKGVVKQIEDYTSYSFQPRALDAPRFEILRPSIESLRWVHKPLLFYAVTQGVFGMLLSHRMKKHNFVRKTTGEISYWTNADSLQSDKIPIVMAHGIGGLCAYFDFVKALMPLDCPMIVLEIPSVSLHIAPNVPSIDTHVSNVKEILDLHGFEKAVFIGHSFGSSIVSWVVQSLPERVAGSVFLDPVVFMVHLTDILQNWTYEAPVNKVSIEGLMDIVKTGTIYT